MKCALRLCVVTAFALGLSGASAEDLPEPRLLEGGDPRGVAFTSDGKSLVVAGNKTGLRVVDVATGKATRTFEVPEKGSGPLAVSADSKWIAVQGWDGKVRVQV